MFCCTHISQQNCTMVCSIQGLPTFMLKCHGCKLSFTLANCGHLIYNQLQQINLYMLCCVVFHSVLCEKRWKNIHSFLHQQSCIVSYKLFIYSTQIHWLSTCNCSLSIHRHLSVSFSLFVFVFSLTFLAVRWISSQDHSWLFSSDYFFIMSPWVKLPMPSNDF